MDGRKFDLYSVVGEFDTDRNGNPVFLTDEKGRQTDKYGRLVNEKGYLVDEDGNVIDCNGEKVFDKRFLTRDGEIPKIFSFTKFKREWVEGDFHRDASGRPIIIPNEKGELVDRQGRPVNQHGMMIDKDGNVITKVSGANSRVL